MKNTLKPFVLLFIFCSIAFSGLSQKRDKTLLKDAPVAVPAQSQVMTLSKDLSVFYNVRQFGAKGDSSTLNTEAIDNVKSDTNRDGFDIDCCRHVHISNCSVNSPFDDAIVLKSSYALGFARLTEDVTITNLWLVYAKICH